jgi:glycosyltransferase involved in cell wall biosynthesis
MPRIIHTVPALFSATGGILGGAERYALELARYMADREPTTLVSFGPRDREESSGNLRIRIFGGAWHVRGLWSNPFSWRALNFLRSADIIHCHQRHIVTTSAAAALARLTGKRVFVSDLGGGGWDISRYIDTAPWFHGHLHISQYSRKISKQEDFPRAHVIMGGVDTTKFSLGPVAQRTGAVLFVGRILPHKGINDLVNGLPDGMRLEVVGQPYDARFYADLQAMAAGKDVVFRHTANDDELVAAYRSALCVVLPSVYQTMYGDRTEVPELLGQTLLEGMACGTPAICTDVASMPEVVDHEVTGFVVPGNDPNALGSRLAWLRDHPVDVARMGEAARRRVVELFSWPAVVERCLRIYNEWK